MAIARPGLALVSLIVTGAAVLFLFFIMLSGGVNHNPLNQIYFLKADTSKIPGAPQTAQWTFWNVCDSVRTGLNVNCSPIKPAHPFDPPRNFGTTQNIDSGFIGVRKFFYMSRFMWAFVVISQVFAVGSFFLGMCALFSRLGSALSAVLAFIALFFTTISACLMTACFVIGRNYFNRNGQPARLGVKAFGFMWGAVACLTFATFIFGSTFLLGRKKDAAYTSTGRSGAGRFWQRKSSTRSKRSFMDTESSRRMKATYN